MKVERPVIIIDLETTGTWIEKDRIIEIAMLKYNPDGSSEEYHSKVNPGIQIPPVVTQLTGISNEDVVGAPYFRQIANDVKAFIKDCDFAGFNIERFDLPLLKNEFLGIGMDLDLREHKSFDAQQVFHFHEKRDLTSAYKFYCGEELIGAHSAMNDVKATFAILKAQIAKYTPDEGTIDSLSQFNYQQSSEFYDSERKFRWWNGELYMMFGKYARKNSLREIAKKDSGYLEWILSKDFSDDIKLLVDGALKGQFPQQNTNV